MANLIGTTLDRLGLYRPLKRTLRYLRDPDLRQREREVREDLDRTRREVGDWASQPVAGVDPDRLFVIQSFTNVPFLAKYNCLVAKTMQLRGYTPVILTLSGCKAGNEYYKIFGMDRLIMWDELEKSMGLEPAEVDRLVDSLLPAAPTVSAVTQIRFHEVEVGKHALSITCRRRIEGQLNLADAATFELLRSKLADAVRSVLVTERFLDENPTDKMFVRDPGYIPNGALFEVALARGIDCVVQEAGQRGGTWIVKRYTKETLGTHYFSLAPSTWDEIRKQPWTAEDDAKLEREFAGRYHPNSQDDTRRLQSGKAVKSPDEVRAQLGLDPNKKTAVIFSHVAWDAAFFFGNCLFDDFEHWLLETVRFAAEACPEMNWIVKVHPFNVFKLQRESVQETSEMRLLKPLMPLPDHVKIMQADTDINTQSLFPLVDYVLTVNGTVGMEFPCYGVPSVLAGTGRYNGRGFTLEPSSREEYFALLKRLHTVPKLSDEERALARRHFYALTVGRQVSFTDVATMELKRLHEAQSEVHNNISVRARSLEAFRASASMTRLGDWLANSQELDLMEPSI